MCTTDMLTVSFAFAIGVGYDIWIFIACPEKKKISVLLIWTLFSKIVSCIHNSAHGCFERRDRSEKAQ